MNIQEFYKEIGESYDEVLNRFRKKERVEKFVSLFASDETYRELLDAFKAEDLAPAFRAAHTLKGLAANLGFSKLYMVSSELTEYLRPQIDLNCKELLAKVMKEYNKVIDLIPNIIIQQGSDA